MTEMTPTVKFDKPALPTLWLDTSVVIKLAKIKKGEALQDVEVRRGTRLRELVSKLVRAGKLLCPESDQEEEYVGERLDDEVHGVFASLSLGISMTHRQGIFDSHVFKGMEAFAKNRDTIILPSTTYFHGDPARRLEETRHERFFVSLGLSKSSELLGRRAEAKAEVSREWEKLRQELVAKGQSYEKQLALEQRGYWDAMVQMVRKAEANIVLNHYNFWDFMAATGAFLYRTYWRELRGEPQGWDGVNKFFCSPYFSELPLPFIGCRLNAELLTGNEPIAPSDPMDVGLLEVALPRLTMFSPTVEWSSG